MAIDLEILKTERDRLKQNLRDLEAEQRKLESQVKGLRQREIHIKREIEALTTLIDVGEAEQSPTSE